MARNGVEIAAAVAPPDEEESYWSPKLSDACRALGVPLATSDELYRCIRDPAHPPRPELAGCVQNIDFVISFLFWERIKKPLIDLPARGCINFHPAPLPDFRGVGGYNVAIAENLPAWGVSAHFVEERFDTGAVIAVDRFSISSQRETAFSLEQKSQQKLLALFRRVMAVALAGSDLPRAPQAGGRYVSKNDFESLRRVGADDPPEVVERKIRAFWYPPYGGASVAIHGKEYTLVSDDLLKEIGGVLHGARREAAGWVPEEHYRSCVANLTIKYVDVVLVVKGKDGVERFLIGKRVERPAQGFWWFAGGRSRHGMPYPERAAELVREDFGIEIPADEFFHIGGARHFWPDSRFDDSGHHLTTDGDVIFYAARIEEPIRLTPGKGFSEIALAEESDARSRNVVLDHAISCYRYHEAHAMPSPDGQRVFRFEY